jgi:UDP-N-acetylmuramyl pentapeptide synthase
MKSLFKKIVTVILSWEARAVIRKYKPTIIAITGSVGKTSAKDATYHMLASAGVFVRKSEKSFNSEIGMPLTILGLQNAWNNPVAWLRNIFHGLGLVFPILSGNTRGDYPKVLVLEVGADHPGDIQNLTSWLMPDIAVITAVSKVPVHVEFFDSPEAVLAEKLSLARGIRSNGKLVLPADNPAILAVRTEPDLSKAPCLTFGIDCAGDVIATMPEIMYEEGTAPGQAHKPIGMSFKLNYQGNSVPITMKGVVGIQHIHSIVAAAATALSYGISFNSIIVAIPHYQAPRGRMNVIDGVAGSVLIDDSYNASPDAVREALKVLGGIQDKQRSDVGIGSETSSVVIRKIAVLGDMMELGTFSPKEHRIAGERAAQALQQTPQIIAADGSVGNMLVTVGIRARDIAEGAVAAGLSREMIHSFDTSIEAGEWLRGVLYKQGLVSGGPLVVVLIKGSQSPRMERVTYALLSDQSRGGELLVRQEPEWLARA